MRSNSKHKSGTRRLVASGNLLIPTLGMLIAIAAQPFLLSSAQAQVWTGAVSDSWSVGANWGSGAVPVTNSQVQVNYAAPNVAVANGIIYGTNRLLTMGGLAGLTGTLTLENSSSFTVAGMILGASGSGDLILLDSHLSSTGNVNIAFLQQGTGSLTVRGSTASFNVLGGSYLDVGASGHGSLEILAGGQVTSFNGFAGDNLGSEGSVLVSGAGSLWAIGDTFGVGGDGNATVLIEDGAGVTAGGLAGVGFGTSSNSVLTVTGVGSYLEATDLVVGSGGNGQLSILDGSTVTTVNGFVGDNPGSQGSVLVSGSGSHWAIGDTFGVGGDGNATVLIEDGGTVAVGGLVGVGFGINSDSSMTVTGSNSSLTAADLIIGAAGRGQFSVLDGATVTAAGISMAEDAGSVGLLYIGGDQNARGVLTASGVTRGAGSAAIAFDGGNLRASQNNGDFLSGFVPGDVQLLSEGGAIDTNGHDIGISTGLVGVGAFTKSGAGTLTLTGTNLYSGGTVVAAGVLQLGDGGTSGSIVGDVVNDGGLVFSRSDAFDFGGTISGIGTIEQRGSNIVTLTGDSTAFAGNTSISAGTLLIDGKLGGTLDVLSGGRLQGNGTIGATNVQAGGVLAPGAPFGTLEATGDLDFAAGAIYESKTDAAGVMSLLHTTGVATIGGGTVRLVSQGSVFRTGARYTILAADGGRAGQFDGLIQTLPLLDVALAYGPNEVYLDVERNSTTLCSLAVTTNQCATSSTEASLGSGNPVVDAVISLPDLASIQSALDLLSGDIHASVKSALVEDSHYIRDAIIDRVRQRLAPAMVPSGGPSEDTGVSSENEVWGRVFGSLRHQDGDGNAAPIDASTSGIIAGADALLSDGFQLGVAAAYGTSSFDVDQRAASAASQDFSLAVYGGKQWGPLGLRFGAAHTWDQVQTDRQIVFPGFADATKANYDARTSQVFLETGYTLPFEDLTLEPFARITQVRLDTDEFNESGGPSALQVGRSGENITYATLGLHAAKVMTLPDDRTVTIRGTVGWRHASGDLTPLSMQAIGNSSDFIIAGVPIAADALIIDAGVEFDFAKDATLGLSYNGQFSGGASENALRADLKWGF